jgi:hypothetical protein
VVDARFVEIVPDVRVVQQIEFVSEDPALHGTMTMTWEVPRSRHRANFAPPFRSKGLSQDGHCRLVAFAGKGRGPYVAVT